MIHESLTIDEIQDMLNKQSWLLGISWVSSDMRDIFAGIDEWNERCTLALEMYINSMVKYIWAYAALLWWVDAIVLTAGVMEHRAIVRKMLLEKLWVLWIILDKKANQDELSWITKISTLDSQVAVFVIPTDEERMIAEETLKLVNN